MITFSDKLLFFREKHRKTEAHIYNKNRRTEKMEKEQLKGFIVKKLFHHGYIGGRHTAVENLGKGLPIHNKGDVKEAIQELIKREILMVKPTSYGLHVSLNPKKREEMQKYLQ